METLERTEGHVGGERLKILAFALPAPVLISIYDLIDTLETEPSVLLGRFIRARWERFRREALPYLWASRWPAGWLPVHAYAHDGRPIPQNRPAPAPEWWEVWQRRYASEKRRAIVILLDANSERMLAEVLREEERLFRRSSVAGVMEAFFASEWAEFRRSIQEEGGSAAV